MEKAQGTLLSILQQTVTEKNMKKNTDNRHIRTRIESLCCTVEMNTAYCTSTTLHWKCLKSKKKGRAREVMILVGLLNNNYIIRQVGPIVCVSLCVLQP